MKRSLHFALLTALLTVISPGLAEAGHFEVGVEGAKNKEVKISPPYHFFIPPSKGWSIGFRGGWYTSLAKLPWLELGPEVRIQRHHVDFPTATITLMNSEGSLPDNDLYSSALGGLRLGGVYRLFGAFLYAHLGVDRRENNVMIAREDPPDKFEHTRVHDIGISLQFRPRPFLGASLYAERYTRRLPNHDRDNSMDHRIHKWRALGFITSFMF